MTTLPAKAGINDEQAIRWTLESTTIAADGKERPKVIAVVGLSDKPERASYGVSRKMQALGYKIVPVTPKKGPILGEQVYKSLQEIPFQVDVVNVFRAPKYVPQVLEDVKTMQHKPTVLWMQEGVIHDEAAADATAYGLHTVQDRCLYKEAMRVLGPDAFFNV